MRRLAIRLIGLAAFGVGTVEMALAADMAVKAPPPPPPSPTYNWTGVYVGGHVGGAWSSDWAGRDAHLPAGGFDEDDLTFGERGSSGQFGVQVGVNWQVAPSWVVGAETDFSWTHIRANSIQPATNGGVPFTGDNDCPGAQVCTAFMNRSLDWVGTVRGRIGYAWDRLLVYFTGGFAYGRVVYSANDNVCCQFPANFSAIKTGSAIGGGLEYALPGGHWTVRGQYLFVDLGRASATVPEQSPPDPPFAIRYDWNETKSHIADVALNYKF